jgi:zinc protease
MKYALGFISTLAAAASVGAQKAPARPAPAPAQQFTFPKVQSHTLANGLRVLIVEDHALPVVAVRAVLGVDETFDPPGKEGTYRIMLGALREGTTSRTPAQIADASAQVGTAISPNAFSTTPSGFEPSLAIMGDMLMHPSFDQAGIDRRKATQAASYRSALSAGVAPARNALYALLNGREDAVTRGFFANEAGVASITTDDVKGFYDRYIGPRSTTVIVTGDVSEASALAAVTREFGSWNASGRAPAPTAPALPSPSATSIHLIQSGATNSYVEIGLTGPARSSPDAFAAEILGTVTTNRMLQTLREKRSLMYSGNMVMIWRALPRRAEFIGATSVAPAKVDTALTEWLGILRSLRSTPPTELEVENAKRARVGPLWVRADGPDSVANRVAEAVRDGLPPNFLERYANGVNAVTVNDVAVAASKYIDLDHLVIVVSGDRKALEPALRATGLAPVVVIDANGKAIP